MQTFTKQAATATCLLLFLLSTSSYGQGKRERLIEKINQPNEPVEIVESQVNDVQLGKLAIKLGQKFTGDDDWLKGLTLKIKNKSGKSIVYLEVNIYIPETDVSEIPIRTSISYGRIPPVLQGGELSVAPEAILHGNHVTLSFPDRDYQAYKNLHKEKRGRDAFDKVEIRLGMIVFNDGTAWNKGRMLHRDPNNPGRWIVNDAPVPSASINKDALDFLEHPKFLRMLISGPLLPNSLQSGCVAYFATDTFACNARDTCNAFAGCSIKSDSYYNPTNRSDAQFRYRMVYDWCKGDISGCNCYGPGSIQV